MKAWDFTIGFSAILGAVSGSNPIRDADSVRIEARQQCGTRRRADGAGRVPIGEPHATGSQSINVRGLVKIGALATQVAPSQVIDDDDYDVWWGDVRRGVCNRVPLAAQPAGPANGQNDEEFPETHVCLQTE